MVVLAGAKQGGPKRESVKKTMQLILIPMGILTNTFRLRDLLDLRLMQVGVIIVKVKMVS